MAGNALRAFIRRKIAHAARHRDANIWLAVILDDSERDSETIVAGALRDTALIGALRKGKRAEPGISACSTLLHR
ncbi:hypothetical protein [Sphingomonas adhaesiva]|uniref:hypothetical protein n=1 Tax=Sphingomonas adhaesiva TaxID=28212 RepID=UPI002FF5E0A3